MEDSSVRKSVKQKYPCFIERVRSFWGMIRLFDYEFPTTSSQRDDNNTVLEELSWINNEIQETYEEVEEKLTTLDTVYNRSTRGFTLEKGEFCKTFDANEGYLFKDVVKSGEPFITLHSSEDNNFAKNVSIYNKDEKFLVIIISENNDLKFNEIVDEDEDSSDEDSSDEDEDEDENEEIFEIVRVVNRFIEDYDSYHRDSEDSTVCSTPEPEVHEYLEIARLVVVETEVERKEKIAVDITDQIFDMRDLQIIKLDGQSASKDELIVRSDGPYVMIYFLFLIKELIYKSQTLWKFDKEKYFRHPFFLSFHILERILYISEVQNCCNHKYFQMISSESGLRISEIRKFTEKGDEKFSRRLKIVKNILFKYGAEGNLFPTNKPRCRFSIIRRFINWLSRSKEVRTSKELTCVRPRKVEHEMLKLFNIFIDYSLIKLDINSNDKGEGYDIHLAKDYKTYTAQPGYGFSVVERMDEDFELIWSTAYPDKSVTYLSIYETKEESLATTLLKDSTLRYLYKPRQYLKPISGMEKIVDNDTRWFDVAHETFDVKRLKGVKSDDKKLSYDEFEVFAVKCYTVIFLGCNLRAILYDDEFLWQLEENPKYGNSVFLIYNPIYGTSAVYHHYIKLDSYKSIKFRSPTQLFEEKEGNMQYLRKNMIRKYLLKHFNEYNNRRCGLCNHVLS
ncbi:hypothetical protein TpMuguga_04g00905 [Theileria parva strain Muguga]|uniref:Uncharacterized protein n=1 Tax=Theileria parva TaxID=5875 RepID=Q4N144_THEPA|nr:uncharacterized protein TpMuguga_04g00905 [Theileria parva strain Muguga]EAN32259.1 hypothetical protein TpMuguga_04g00905 [Theileria parva strain Muguga]|eukprot:XP_764542.1 hypothetical protein [Theileria parva strain Muguga]